MAREPDRRTAYHRVRVTDAIRAASPYTLAKERLGATARALLQLDRDQIAGDIVECGVWMGGNVIIARIISPHRRCWLYDTFTGMTKPGEEDGPKALDKYKALAAKKQPWCKATLSQLIHAMNETDTYDDKLCRIIVGDVVQTLTDPANVPSEIALLRLDTDFYASTKMELEILFPRLAIGGILIVDDYGHWQGARQAVDEFFADKPETAETLERIDYTAIIMTRMA
jgi:O-methyltransferase